MVLLTSTVSAMICLFTSILLLLHPASSFLLPGRMQQVLPSFLPKHWYDEQSNSTSCLRFPDTGDKNGWDILYHLGGNGPWIPKVDDVVDGGIRVPEGCEIDMVHMMSRHGERYPTKKAGARMMDMIARVKAAGTTLQGDLEFLNDWEYFTNSPETHFEQLTTTGLYAGVLEAFTTGVKLFTRYGYLRSNLTSAQTYLWASESDRVIDTARHFSAGFFGLESPSAKVVVISEAEDKGGDTLTPGRLSGRVPEWPVEHSISINFAGKTCTNYTTDEVRGHDYGYEMLDRFRSTYLPKITTRLSIQNPGLDFTDDEVFAMQEMCGFELTIRGRSPWCNVFTHEEWASFEYARDIIHFYRAGPGNPYARSMGWLWLNATTNLLLEGPSAAGSLYFTFVHDGDIVPMLSALGLFEDSDDLPVTHIQHDRKWATSQITPMGGRIIFERLTCSASSSQEEKSYVRFNVNDGIVALDGCNSGPGSSCPLEEFATYVKNRGEKAGAFAQVCGLDIDAPESLSFLRQPGYGGHVQGAETEKHSL